MPDEAPEIKVTLSAEDQGLSASLRQLSESLKGVDRQQQELGRSSARAAAQAKANYGSIRQAAAQMSDAIKLRLANIPGLGGFGSMVQLRAYEPIGKFAEEAGGKLDEVFGAAGPAILGFTGALVGLGAAAAAVTLHMVDMAQSIENTAAATGLSTDQVQQFTEIAKEMDIDAAGLQQAFARMQSQLGEFVATGSATGSGSQYFVRVLKEMNVQLTDASGNLRPVNDILSDFYDRLQKIPNAEQRTAVEMAAFGTRGQVIAQLFAEASREGISYRDMLDKINASGVVLTTNQIASLEETKGKWDDVTRAIRGAWTQLGLFTSQAATHPLTTFANLAAYGVAGGTAITNVTAGIALTSGEPGGAAAAPHIQGPDAKTLGKLDQQLAVLKAGGELQLELKRAEAAYAATKKEHATAAMQGYAQEISDLKQIIALESEKKSAHAAAKDQHRQEQIDEANRSVTEKANEAISGEIPRLAKARDKAWRKEQQRQRERLRFQEQLLEAEGKTFAAALLKIQEEADEYRRVGATAAEVDALVTQQTAQARFEQAARQTSGQFKTFDIEKGNIDLRSGESKAQREREYKSLLAEEIPLLQEKVDLEMKAARASGNQDDMLRAQEDQQKLAGLQNQLKTQTQSLAQQVQGPISESFKQFFDQVGRGTQTMQQQFQGLAAGIVQAFQKVFEQKLFTQLVAMINPSGGKSGASGFFGGIFSSMAGGSGHARGGYIRGAGSSTSDSIPARLSAGEFVMNAAATRAFGAHNLDAINRGARFAMGGYVNPRGFESALHFSEGGMVPAPEHSNVNLNMHVGLDEGVVLRHLSSKAAGRVILNHISNNPKAASKAISRAS